jgi:hypothetical protein
MTEFRELEPQDIHDLEAVFHDKVRDMLDMELGEDWDVYHSMDYVILKSHHTTSREVRLYISDQAHDRGYGRQQFLPDGCSQSEVTSERDVEEFVDAVADMSRAYQEAVVRDRAHSVITSMRWDARDVARIREITQTLLEIRDMAAQEPLS